MLIPRSSDISVDSARDRSAWGSIEMARTRSIADIHEIKQDLHEPSCCATRLKTCKQRTVKMPREQAAPWRASAAVAKKFRLSGKFTASVRELADEVTSQGCACCSSCTDAVVQVSRFGSNSGAVVLNPHQTGRSLCYQPPGVQ